MKSKEIKLKIVRNKIKVIIPLDCIACVVKVRDYFWCCILMLIVVIYWHVCLSDFLTFYFYCASENPREFLIEQLEQLKICRQGGGPGPSLFNSSNLDAAFQMLDPANEKHITCAQYKQGELILLKLGQRGTSHSVEAQSHPHSLFWCSLQWIHWFLFSIINYDDRKTSTIFFQNTDHSFSAALTTMGIRDINECPEGVNEDKISYETFQTEGWDRFFSTAVFTFVPCPPVNLIVPVCSSMDGLQRCSATYQQGPPPSW